MDRMITTTRCLLRIGNGCTGQPGENNDGRFLSNEPKIFQVERNLPVAYSPLAQCYVPLTPRKESGTQVKEHTRWKRRNGQFML
jgi:hypothetical protein